jgi:hypothetical protein
MVQRLISLAQRQFNLLTLTFVIICFRLKGIFLKLVILHVGWLRAGRLRCRSSSPGRVKNFLFSTSSRPVLGSTQSPIQGVPGALSSGVKRSGREADHSPPNSAEVKKMWLYTYNPPYAFMV